jgi:hypothetical protein
MSDWSLEQRGMLRFLFVYGIGRYHRRIGRDPSFAMRCLLKGDSADHQFCFALCCIIAGASMRQKNAYSLTIYLIHEDGKGTASSFGSWK